MQPRCDTKMTITCSDCLETQLQLHYGLLDIFNEPQNITILIEIVRLNYDQLNSKYATVLLYQRSYAKGHMMRNTHD